MGQDGAGGGLRPPFSASDGGLRWQSHAVLLPVCVAAAAYAGWRVDQAGLGRGVLGGALVGILGGAACSVGFAVVVFAARAATPGAALMGALLAFCFALTPTGAHSALWLLVAMLGMTLGASRVGRRRKLAQGTAEGRSGRRAAQVAANLGVAAVSGLLVSPLGRDVAEVALLAALAEATADTLASELGQLASAPPRMLLTGRRVAPGTDGALSVPGTLAGVGGAGVLAVLAWWVLALPSHEVLLGWAAGVVGLFVDSLLGQLLERRGVLNNDAVNFLSTLAAAGVAVAGMR